MRIFEARAAGPTCHSAGDRRPWPCHPAPVPVCRDRTLDTYWPVGWHWQRAGAAPNSDVADDLALQNAMSRLADLAPRQGPPVVAGRELGPGLGVRLVP